MTEILDNGTFYARSLAYQDRVDPTWIRGMLGANLAFERSALGILGEPMGRRVLDCSCGTGLQAIALAQLGWHVAGCDHTPSAVAFAERFAGELAVKVDFSVCDMRRLAQALTPGFDAVVTCKALDNLGEAADIALALDEIRSLLNPGGLLYIRQRALDQVLEDKPRYELRDIRPVPYGRVIQLEDWEYPDHEHLVYILVYLREDSRHPEYWETTYLACRRYTLTQSSLEKLLDDAGFRDITWLPRENRWADITVVAVKP